MILFSIILYGVIVVIIGLIVYYILDQIANSIAEKAQYLAFMVCALLVAYTAIITFSAILN